MAANRLKIKIHPTFIPVILLAAVIGEGPKFILSLLAVTIHELAHVLVGRLFNRPVGQLTLTPLGEIAEIEGIEDLPMWARSAIVLAGPCINLLLFLCFDGFFAFANLALFLFNMLPMYPMDGGRLGLVLSGGTRPAGKKMIQISRVCACGVLALGVVQVIYYPPNISLLCVAVYLLANSRKELLRLEFQFLRHFSGKRAQKKLPIRCYTVGSGLSAYDLMDYFHWDYYSVFDIGGPKITETEVMEAVYGSEKRGQQYADFREQQE